MLSVLLSCLLRTNGHLGESESIEKAAAVGVEDTDADCSLSEGMVMCRWWFVLRREMR